MLPLAEFAPLSPAAQAAIVSVLSVALNVVLIWSIIRRKPPLDTELVKLNTAIDGLQKAVDALTETAKEHADHSVEIASLKEKVKVLEAGREADSAGQRKYTRETTHEIFAKLDAIKDQFTAAIRGVESTFAANVQSVERAMGRVEGELKSIGERVAAIDAK